MDPNACLQAALDALADLDRDEAINYLSGLVGWLMCGGAMPDLDKLGWSKEKSPT